MELFRRVFASLLFLFILTRTPDVLFFFGEGGVLPLERLSAAMELGARKSVFFYFSSDAALWVGHFALLASLAALAWGFRPRLMAAVAAVLHISFLHRNMMPAYGIDSISVFFLLYQTFADSKRADSALGSVAFRLSQIQVCVIYFYSGLEKLRGSHWWYGDAIWQVLANHQLAVMDFSWVTAFPLVIVLATWSTLVWEVYFPALIWVPILRPWVLLGGVLLHLGIALSMGIPFFGLMMICTYAVFLTEGEADRLLRLFCNRCVKKD